MERPDSSFFGGNATWNISSGATVNNLGSLTVGGVTTSAATITINGGALICVGTSQFGNGAVLNDGGTLIFNSNATFSSGATFNYNGRAFRNGNAPDARVQRRGWIVLAGCGTSKRSTR